MSKKNPLRRPKSRCTRSRKSDRFSAKSRSARLRRPVRARSKAIKETFRWGRASQAIVAALAGVAVVLVGLWCGTPTETIRSVIAVLVSVLLPAR